MTTSDGPDPLIMTMQRVGVVLKQTGLPFALAGSMAVYALGGDEVEHDVDFLIRERDVQAVLDAMREAGFTVSQPPEDWLVKVYDEDRLVDLIHRPVEQPVTDELLARATDMRVHALTMPVLPATDLVVHKLLALSEHNCDLSRVLPTCRSLREQVDWAAVHAATDHWPFAAAVLYLLRRLHITPADPRQADEPYLLPAQPQEVYGR